MCGYFEQNLIKSYQVCILKRFKKYIFVWWELYVEYFLLNMVLTLGECRFQFKIYVSNFLFFNCHDIQLPGKGLLSYLFYLYVIIPLSNFCYELELKIKYIDFNTFNHTIIINAKVCVCVFVRMCVSLLLLHAQIGGPIFIKFGVGVANTLN